MLPTATSSHDVQGTEKKKKDSVHFASQTSDMLIENPSPISHDSPGNAYAKEYLGA